MGDTKLVIIAGIGPGLSTSLAKTFAVKGYKVGGLARRAEHLEALEADLGSENFTGITTDLTDLDQAKKAHTTLEQKFGPTTVYVHNATSLLVKPFLEISGEEFETIWRSAVMTAFNGAQAVLPGMVERNNGSFLVTGATAAMRGGPNFSAFASAKFALRGLTQSLARQFGPEGVHVAHVVIDGVIWGASAKRYEVAREKCLEPDHIAETYLQLAQQPRSCWTHEIDIRPNSESF